MNSLKSLTIFLLGIVWIIFGSHVLLQAEDFDLVGFAEREEARQEVLLNARALDSFNDWQGLLPITAEDHCLSAELFVGVAGDEAEQLADGLVDAEVRHCCLIPNDHIDIFESLG